MPTTSIASADSRQTMKSALPMFARMLLGDDLALRGLFVELVEEPVLARLQRIDDERRLRARRDHLLLLQVLALELDRLLALVRHFEAEALPGRDLDRRRFELAVLGDDLVDGHLLRERGQRDRRESE